MDFDAFNVWYQRRHPKLVGPDFLRATVEAHDEFLRWPCHELPERSWCDLKGPGGFMGHTCSGEGRDVERLTGQARAIEELLRAGDVGSCSLPEGVRRLLNRAEQAESRLAVAEGQEPLTVTLAREVASRQRAEASLTDCQAENTRLVNENRRLGQLELRVYRLPPFFSSSDEYDALDPGIRHVVIDLHRAGFVTTDSGDGVTKKDQIADGSAMAVPNVAARTTIAEMVADAERMRGVLGEGWTVQASYSTADKSAVLLATRG